MKHQRVVNPSPLVPMATDCLFSMVNQTASEWPICGTLVLRYLNPIKDADKPGEAWAVYKDDAWHLFDTSQFHAAFGVHPPITISSVGGWGVVQGLTDSKGVSFQSRYGFDTMHYILRTFMTDKATQQRLMRIFSNRSKSALARRHEQIEQTRRRQRRLKRRGYVPA